jgi:hypothetical protein
MKSGGEILAVQTLRNSILVASLLASACLTISVGVLAFLGSSARPNTTSPFLQLMSNSFLLINNA